ncbi:MAG: M15 family metallopeptidase [Candidatus Paceibacterota bacterium]|jgi:LAS superfamily LD-carboxypeptidase LdcB
MKKSFLIPFIIVLAAAGAYLIYLQWQNNLLKEQSRTLTEQLESTSDSLSKIQNQNRSLMTSLIEAVGKAANYSSVLNQTSQKVSDLEELTNTDPQLLYKYSKVFFLNENYTPPAVTPIDSKYLYNKDKPMDFHDRAWPFLRNLLDAAERDGIDLKVISAYRSFGTQATLKSSYKVTYGAGTANSFSADQGYSEHQLATTVDFTTSSVGATFTGFEKTPAYKWLVANAHIYGFILSYPAGNSFYVYEPWHWRFVGLDLAQKLHTDGKYFYDLDQREINTYLGKIWNATSTSTYR